MRKTEAVTLMTDETFEVNDAATAADAKQGSKPSELRTVRAITNKLPEELRPKAKDVFDAVQSNWRAYLIKDTAFRENRSNLAAALIEARKLVVS